MEASQLASLGKYQLYDQHATAPIFRGHSALHLQDLPFFGDRVYFSDLNLESGGALIMVVFRLAADFEKNIGDIDLEACKYLLPRGQVLADSEAYSWLFLGSETLTWNRTSTDNSIDSGSMDSPAFKRTSSAPYTEILHPVCQSLTKCRASACTPLTADLFCWSCLLLNNMLRKAL